MEVPGQPKTMADRVTRLAKRALQLRADVWYGTPKQYREGARARTEVASAWSYAYAASTRASEALEQLTQLLRRRADMPPWKGTYLKRKTVPDSETE